MKLLDILFGTRKTHSSRPTRVRTRLEIEPLEDRCLLAVFEGLATGVFIDPAPSSAVVSGVGTNHFTWGVPVETGPSALTFNGVSFQGDVDEIFSLGTLSYFNGTTLVGTTADSVKLKATTDISAPSGVSPQDFTFPFTLVNTTNTGDPIGDADYVLLPTSFSRHVFSTPEGSQFTLELVGFGTVTGSGFSTVNQFFVQESASASAQLLGRFVLVPDLVGVNLQYRVPADGTGESNGPLPVNRPFIVSATIQNQGLGRAGGFDVAFYASTNSTIDPATDLRLGTAHVTSILAPGAQTMLSQSLQLQSSLPTSYAGRIWVGMVINLDTTVPEGSYDNNQNRGDQLDRRSVQLYDPIAERGVWRDASELPSAFASERDAERHLRANGFTPSFIPGFTDIGWSRPLTSSTYSRFNGRTMAGPAFRIQAGVSEVSPGVWQITVQGAEAGFNPANLTLLVGEPSPRAGREWGAELFFYVRQYHRRF